jgi:hypothetical protein
MSAMTETLKELKQFGLAVGVGLALIGIVATTLVFSTEAVPQVQKHGQADLMVAASADDATGATPAVAVDCPPSTTRGRGDAVCNPVPR